VIWTGSLFLTAATNFGTFGAAILIFVPAFGLNPVRAGARHLLELGTPGCGLIQSLDRFS
jgi:hypothetical protein